MTRNNSSRPVALITGASAGIGATFARTLAGRGYDLILVARRRDRLDSVAAALALLGARADALPADLTNRDDLERVAARIASEDRLELLINNAGFGTRGRFWEAPVEGQVDMHRLHVMATMRLCHAALAAMVPRRRGGVINVSSVAGFIQNSGNTSYAATKCWMNSFTEGLYLELKSAGSPVKVQALCPGFTLTEFHDVMGADRKAVPAWLWMKAEVVVERSLRGLERGELFVIPGWIYKMIVLIVPHIPRFLRTPGVMRYSRHSRRSRRELTSD